MPATSVIGMDEIAIRKGHDYRVVVRDLERQRPIWFGGSEILRGLRRAPLCGHLGRDDGHVENVSPGHARAAPRRIRQTDHQPVLYPGRYYMAANFMDK